MADESQQKPQLHIDSDWKAQAQAEKERLAREAEAAQGQGGGGPQELPPADFQTLLSSLVTQALLYMGAIPDPMSGQRVLHMDLARHHIDLVGVLEEKTKGNLDDEEHKMLTQTLHELRLNYLQLSKQVAEHLQKQAAGKAPQGKPSGGSPKPEGGASGIIMP